MALVAPWWADSRLTGSVQAWPQNGIGGTMVGTDSRLTGSVQGWPQNGIGGTMAGTDSRLTGLVQAWLQKGIGGTMAGTDSRLTGSVQAWPQKGIGRHHGRQDRIQCKDHLSRCRYYPLSRKVILPYLIIWESL